MAAGGFWFKTRNLGANQSLSKRRSLRRKGKRTRSRRKGGRSR